MKAMLLAIAAIVKENQSVSVTDLSQQLQFSEVTIRKYLAKLEKMGFIQRSHGRASIMNDNSVPSFSQRKNIEIDEKHLIATEAANFVEDGDSIMIDAGTTPLTVARLIKEKNVSVVTNSLAVGMELHEFKGTVTLTGGDIINSNMALYGPDTQNFLDNVRVNKLILGTSGFRNDYGFTTSSSIEAAIKQKMIKCAQQVILVADHTKFSRIKIATFASFSDIDTVVTSELTSSDVIELLQNNGIKVILSPAKNK